MKTDSTIPIRSNYIRVYICREHAGELEMLLISKDSLLDWSVSHVNVKYSELCWQAALAEVRRDTGNIPDRIYSVNKVETTFCVVTHSILLSPVFVAFFDHGQETTPMIQEVTTMWVKVKDATFYLEDSNHKEALTVLREEFYLKEPSEKLKVYPAKF